ncbi:electron transfer protein DM13 [Candidatus Nitrosocosmicus arcticus]|uniref:Electron transfer protein DM13 n=1 Tax=Candidatus Nitrosocosmicus arcticus TaxID=2035267 RepID=A0A557SV09_9ARCH|nr:electron transfer protein DM13 [Candidatus Nitrosocosmicus arcticus]
MLIILKINLLLVKDTEHKNLYKKITYLTVAIIAAVVTVYLASPLFISTEINEPFPPNSAALVSFENFSIMSEDERAKSAENMSASQKNELMIQYANSDSNATNIIDESMNETESLSEPNNSLISGSFIGVNDGIHNAEGTAKVVPLQQVDSNILRLENLKVTNGPDLYVYLSTDKSASDIVNLGKLKANNGNQNYNIPTGTDLSKYDTVLIWCKAFSVLFGSVELKVQ